MFKLPKQTRRIETLEIDPLTLGEYREVEADLAARIAKNPGLLDSVSGGFLMEIRQALGFAKIKPAIAWLRANPAPGPRIVFAHHISVQREIAKAFPGSIWLSADLGPRKRAIAIDAFQTGQVPYLVTSPGIGGLGLNLTAARQAVFCEYEFTAVSHEQPAARLDRIGQTAATECVYLHVRDTIDDFFKALIGRKHKMSGEAIDNEAGLRFLENLPKRHGVRVIRRNHDDVAKKQGPGVSVTLQKTAASCSSGGANRVTSSLAR